MNLENFYDSLNAEFLELVEVINASGFKLGLVGGITRDFLLSITEKEKDYDCELRPTNTENFIQQYENLKIKLEKRYKCQDLAFGILRIQKSSFTCELSLPRIEKHDGSIGHKNFDVEFIADEDYSKGFKRRDFTLNAIMFEIYNSKIRVRDPLGGIKDLKAKILKPCSEDFSKDIVRYLRLVRFKLRLGREYTTSVNLENLPWSIDDYPVHYLKLEMQKSHLYLDFMLELFKIHNIFVAPKGIEFVGGYQSLVRDLSAKEVWQYACFLDSRFRLRACELLGFTVKDVPESPWRLSSLAVEESLQILRFYEELPAKVLDFYQKSEISDFNSSDLAKFKKIDIDLSQIPQVKRSEVQLIERLRIYFGN